MTLSMAGKVVSDSVVAQRAGATVPMAVVIPTFDRRELLQELLEAVDALDPAPAEVVVVSDGSSDGTDELVADLGVTLLVTPRLGPAAARNAGWRATTSDVVAFVDDDCLPDPSWLGRLWTAFSALPEVGVVQGRTRPVRPPGPYERTIDVASEYGLYESCNVAYRRQALEQVGGFDESFSVPVGAMHFGEDADLAWRVKRRGWQSRFAEDAVVEHRVFPGTFVELLQREWTKGRFPYLVRRIPELRGQLPAGRLFLRRHSPHAQLALVGALTAVRRPLLGMALAAPYGWWLVRNRPLRSVPGQVAADLAGSLGLVAGSVRHRRVVL